MNYISWNNLVGEYLFKASNKNQEVFLCLSEDDLVLAVKEKARKPGANSIFSELSLKPRAVILNDFWSAMRSGPAFWHTNTPDYEAKNPALFAKLAWESWNKSEVDPKTKGGRIRYIQNGESKVPIRMTAPLHLLYLLSFSFPLLDVGEDSSNRYYEAWVGFYRASERGMLRNGSTLSTQALGGLGFNIWAQMWKEIERWSNVDLECERGKVLVENHSNPHWTYVGIPASQCLLPLRCLNRLDRQFFKDGLTSQSESRISNEALSRCLLHVEGLPPSTRRILNAGPSHNLFGVLIEQVRRRLASYKGFVLKERDPSHDNALQSNGEVYESAISELVLFAVPGGFSKLSFYHRLKPQAEAESSLVFTYDRTHFVCETGAAWSKPIHGIPLVVGRTVLEDKKHNWKAVAHLGAVQFFVPSTYLENLPDYIQVDDPTLGELLVICNTLYAGTLRHWLHECGTVIKDAEIKEGAAQGFHYIRAEVKRLKPAPEGLPFSFRTEKNIEAIGGLRIGGGEYFAHRMPAFRALGSGEDLFLRYLPDSKPYPLVQSPACPGLWELPVDHTRADSWFVITNSDRSLESKAFRGIYATLPVLSECPEVIRDLFLESIQELPSGLEYANGISVQVPNAKAMNASQRFGVLYNHYFNGDSTRDITPEGSKITISEFSDADDLLYLLSAKGRLNREEFREAFGFLRPTAGKEWRYSMRWFGRLGHAAYEFVNGSDTLTILPATLSQLPGTGDFGNRYLLTGIRLPGLLKRLADWGPLKIRLHVEKQYDSNSNLLLPDAVILEGKPLDIKLLADEFKLKFDTWMPTAAQWLILCGGIDNYLEMIAQMEINSMDLPPPTHPHRYFDPDKVHMADARLSDGEQLPYDTQTGALVEYPMRRGKERYRLWLDGKAYHIDPTWGRYIVLARHDKRVLQICSGKLFVPASAPLPGGVGIAASLLSGLVPAVERIGNRLYYVYPATAWAMLKNELRNRLCQQPIESPTFCSALNINLTSSV